MRDRRWLRAATAALGLCLCCASALAEELPVLRVGMVFDGPGPANEEVRALTIAEVETLMAGEIDVRFPEASLRVGDWSYDTSSDAVMALLEDPEVDLVITWGVLASNALCCLAAPPKPVIAPVILDVDLQNIPYSEGTSGVPNLSYVAFPDNTANELQIFREIVPFQRIVFLAPQGILEAIPEMAMRTQLLLSDLGLTSSYVPVDRDADAVDRVLAEIPEGTDAVYVWPLSQLPLAEAKRLVDGLNARRLPTFSALADDSFEFGMLASMAEESFFPRLARRVALNLQRIALGEPAGSLPVDLSVRGRLTLNLATAEAIGVSPRWDMLIEADLVGVDRLEGFEPVSFDEAVYEAVEANLDLQARERSVAAGAQEVERARAVLRPDLTVSATGVGIDDDRAGAGQAERTLTGRLALTQLIYDDAARANVVVQDQVQIAREADFDILRLDIALDTATAYLNLLRAVSLAEVQRSNLELTRSNLERAEIRRSVGAANPAEVFRWESQIANDRRSLIDAMASIARAEIVLSQLLDRALDTRYRAAEVDLDDPLLITGKERLDGYLDTPVHFQTFSDFTVEEGLASAPELAAVRANIAAQERLVTSAQRAFYLPQVTLQGLFDEVLADEGEGADLSAPGLPDDSSWSLSLGASLPLFTGGSRRAERIQAEETLSQLGFELDATSDRLEQRIRAAMVSARASFTGIDLTREAAEASQRNLDLVADSYSRGAVSIINLLDAQNSALAADQAATNAVYDFLINLMELQRAANQFDFFTSPAARGAWFSRLVRYFDDRGVAPWPEDSRGD